MKIYCPKCHTCYSLDPAVIPAKGKKLRCANCNEVWLCFAPENDTDEQPVENIIDTTDNLSQPAEEETTDSAVDGNPPAVETSEPETTEADNPTPETNTPQDEPEATEAKEQPAQENISNAEMQQIFSRLKTESDKLGEEKNKLPAFKKNFPAIKKLLGWNNYLIITAEILIILPIIGLSIFSNRYELVRKFPQIESLFSRMGVPSRVIGEGLEFQNVVRSFDNDETPSVLTIKGFIFNTTDSRLPLPVIAVNISDSDGIPLKKESRKLDTDSLNPKSKLPFSLQVEVPARSKYIELTFTE